jgi:hypothetical protein
MQNIAEDDLALGIARDLDVEGTCVRWVRPIPAQRVVDVRWAAKRAGRMIGQHVRTSVAAVSDRPDSDVAVVVTVDPESPST